MRVTVKIQSTEVESVAVRHNLDLYNDTQVEKLIRKTAAKLEIGTSVIEASINELIEALEKYRLEQLEQRDDKPQTKQLTEKEKSEALQLLQSENLLTITNDLIGQSGIIGEETNRLIMYLTRLLGYEINFSCEDSAEIFSVPINQSKQNKKATS